MCAQTTLGPSSSRRVPPSPTPSGHPLLSWRLLAPVRLTVRATEGHGNGHRRESEQPVVLHAGLPARPLVKPPLCALRLTFPCERGRSIEINLRVLGPGEKRPPETKDRSAGLFTKERKWKQCNSQELQCYIVSMFPLSRTRAVTLFPSVTFGTVTLFPAGYIFTFHFALSKGDDRTCYFLEEMK